MGAATLLEGPVGRGLLRFVLPILAGNILQQLYNSVDAMIIGRYVGEAALGAIGASQPIISIVLALVIGLGIGMEIISALTACTSDSGTGRRPSRWWTPCSQPSCCWRW